MNGIFDDGAAFGPNPDAQPPQDTPTDPIYDDGAQYGAHQRAVRTTAMAHIEYGIIGAGRPVTGRGPGR
ncbi:hypothetical protein [Streptomyces sp. SR-10]|uniref:hypothetical protein n=1 Tax=Streptomyces sp. SR-10 TaxID=3416442 RepID=UPI003CF17F02